MATELTLAELVAQMRELGVTRYKKDGIEIDLGPAPFREADPEDPSFREKMNAQIAETEKEYRMKTMFRASSIRPVLRPKQR